MELMDILYLTCSIPSVAIAPVHVYVMLCVAPCVLWLYMDGSDLDTSVGHHPYGIKSMVPKYDHIRTSWISWISCTSHVAFRLLLWPLYMYTCCCLLLHVVLWVISWLPFWTSLWVTTRMASNPWYLI